MASWFNKIPNIIGKLAPLFVQPSKDPSKGFEVELFTTSLPVQTGQADVVIYLRCVQGNSAELTTYVDELRKIIVSLHNVR